MPLYSATLCSCVQGDLPNPVYVCEDQWNVSYLPNFTVVASSLVVFDVACPSLSDFIPWPAALGSD